MVFPSIWAVSRAGVPPWRSRSEHSCQSVLTLGHGALHREEREVRSAREPDVLDGLAEPLKGYVVLVGLAGRAAQSPSFT